MTRTALITGAGIAGEVAAWWLARFGWRCTVIERSSELRTQGQNIDVRGAAREVLRRMPSGGFDGRTPARTVDDEVGDRSTGEVGTRFVDGDDTPLAEFPAGESDTDGATAEREILRGQLAELLFERTRGDVDHRFGLTVLRCEEAPDGLDVTFSDGSSERFDVLLVAEGVGSTTRRRVFGDTAERRALGLTMGYYSVARAPEDDDWWNWYNAPDGRSVTTRPDNVGRTRVTLSFRSDDRHDELSRDEQKLMLRDRFAGAGWRTERLLAGLDVADDLYLEDLGQIVSPTWSSGRVALLGDAAWCATPVSGMGTSLAIVGGYVLAGELAAHVHHRDGFAGYERILRPYVEQAQKLPPGTPQVVHPRSAIGLGVLRTALRVAGSAPVKAVSGGLISPPADKIDLPDYAHLIPVDGNSAR
ncbi:FAD-binding monooxygenase [Nakamurella flava]|uniref:FAD-binding monooxygenase n=1 Tax=Nakamurella flava TaxID=2576308 RepID=A0A4U6QFL2_9ACTN|nr:FAD-dependent monooxygenase [Nakamurella flava]TKV58832.1 FAD-binding monooxygenase [Nakamurella flava]